MRIFLTAVAVSAVGTLSLSSAAPVFAQATKAPAKSQTKTSKHSSASPTDNQADKLNEQWLKEHANGTPAEMPADAAPASAPTTAAASAPAPSAPATATDNAPTVSAPAAPATVTPVAASAPMPGPGARTLVTNSVKLVSAKDVAGFLPGGAKQDTLKPLTEAFAGFSITAPAHAPKVQMFEGQTADGTTHLLYAALGEGKSKHSYWWFTPIDQPEGWFDEDGKRLGATVLGEAKPGGRISSPFGTRRYYGKVTSGHFHDGIDYEAKIGDPIYAAADGVINHQDWYYQYGRTVKITHGDNFETLYAHMSRFETGLAPGSHVKKGDVVGYVGMTGRSTGPHLHFSVIVGGKFVDPQPYISENGGHNTLSGESLVAYRQWQQDVRTASEAQAPKRSSTWSSSPFTNYN